MVFAQTVFCNGNQFSLLVVLIDDALRFIFNKTLPPRLKEAVKGLDWLVLYIDDIPLVLVINSVAGA